MLDFISFENILAFLTLSSLEIILGIDNIVFIAITTDRLPEHQKAFARKAGLFLAMLERILLLFFVSWMTKLRDPLFSVAARSFSGRDLILIAGGLFLIVKATLEIHNLTEHAKKKPTVESKVESPKGKASLYGVLIQIFLLDTVFSFDSVVTAVGMVDSLATMILAIITSVLIMMSFANRLSEFILKHPSLKTLALSFLFLIGVLLVADGLGNHIEKGYIYFAIGFSALVEGLNFRLKNR